MTRYEQYKQGQKLTLRLLPWIAFEIVVAFAVGHFATFASRHGNERKMKISKTFWVLLLHNQQLLFIGIDTNYCRR